MSLTLRVLHERSAFAALREDWNRLAALEGAGIDGLDASASFEWAEAIWTAFPERVPKAVVVASRADGSVCGLLPCTIVPNKLARVPHRLLTPVTGLYDLRTGLLVAGDAEVATALLGHSLANVPGWDAMSLRCTVGSPSEAALLSAVARLGLAHRELRRWRTPWIELPGDPAAAAESVGTTRLRANVRRAERQLLKLGTLDMELAERPDQVEPFLAVMNDVESRSWKLAAGTAMVGVEQQQRMYRAVMSGLAPNGRWLGAALRLNGTPIAFICGFAQAGVFVDEKESYDDAFKDQGPGNVLKLRFLPELVRRGIRVHDYGGEEDAHKARWTERRYERRQWLVHRATPRGLALRAVLALRDRSVASAPVRPAAGSAAAPAPEALARGPALAVQNFEPGAVVLPQPRVPALPPLRWSTLRDGLVLRPAAPLPPGMAVRSYARCRYAMAEAYRQCGVGPQAPLLAPALHCLTMIDPALRLGAGAMLYPLREDLSPDLERLEAMLAKAAQRPAALLLTHYFGIVQDAAPVLEWCARHGLALIEDCSHTHSGLRARGVGSAGRYSVWSPYKFHPCADGGELQANRGAPLPPALPGPGAWAQLRAVWHAVRGLRPVRRGLDAAAAAQELAALAAQPAGDGLESQSAYERPSPQYLAGEERQAALPSSRWIVAHSDPARLASRRRQRFQQWLEAVRTLVGCRPLYPQLPAGDVPYMFPLLVDEPARHFMPLKRLGFTLWRWDNMALPLGSPPCALSQRLRLGLFQLPCHQELDDTEMAWMTAALRAQLSTSPTAATAATASAAAPATASDASRHHEAAGT
jgi:CelD/BcsL family acetyltransferase involved in cellulose biosynthesis